MKNLQNKLFSVLGIMVLTWSFLSSVQVNAQEINLDIEITNNISPHHIGHEFYESDGSVKVCGSVYSLNENGAIDGNNIVDFQTEFIPTGENFIIEDLSYTPNENFQDKYGINYHIYTGGGEFCYNNRIVGFGMFPINSNTSKQEIILSGEAGFDILNISDGGVLSGVDAPSEAGLLFDNEDYNMFMQELCLNNQQEFGFYDFDYYFGNNYSFVALEPGEYTISKSIVNYETGDLECSENNPDESFSFTLLDETAQIIELDRTLYPSSLSSKHDYSVVLDYHNINTSQGGNSGEDSKSPSTNSSNDGVDISGLVRTGGLGLS